MKIKKKFLFLEIANIGLIYKKSLIVSLEYIAEIVISLSTVAW